MTGSRFDWRKPLTLERLKDFVAIEDITAQRPLIEIGQPLRIWLAYDISRTQGTFMEVHVDGMVKTVTVYPSGKRHEILNRPQSSTKGFYRTEKQDTVQRKPRRAKKLFKGKQTAVPKKQTDLGDNVPQVRNRRSRLTKGVQTDK